MTDRIAASIEVSPAQAVDSADLEGLFPAGTRAYITDIGNETAGAMTAAARRLTDLGYVAVPHFASRRLTTSERLATRVKMLTQEAGVTDVLVVGGGLNNPNGDFCSTMEVLETAGFDRHGVTHIGVAGHPEGSPDFSDEVAMEALRLKQDFSARSDARLRIVTQFGFDAPGFIAWADALADAGIGLPVHLGVAGPAKVTTLIKFAAMCGIGNSVTFLKKRGGAIATLATGFNPESVVGPIEGHVAAAERTAIRQVHVFPFGGLKKTAEWLADRGSWSYKDISKPLYPDLKEVSS